jgi:hypothetical protein
MKEFVFYRVVQPLEAVSSESWPQKNKIRVLAVAVVFQTQIMRKRSNTLQGVLCSWLCFKNASGS